MFDTFFTDKFKKGKSRAVCGAADVLTDYFTRPLQGALFWKLRDVILNIRTKDGPGSIQLPAHRSVLDPTVEGETQAAVTAKKTICHSSHSF